MRRKSALEMGAKVVEHWYTLIPAQQFSSKEFYEHIEGAIKTQQVPGLAISRVDFAEGGMLSDKREYLRMKRERLTFDVCAAPVGVNYFFSYRFYVEPVVVTPADIAIVTVALGVLLAILAKIAGLLLGLVFLFAICAVAAVFMRTAIGENLRDLDAALAKIPGIGPIYERFFRKDTYYRQDMRIAYCSIVSTIVKHEVETATAAKGVVLYREFTYSPVFDGLYSAKQVKPSASREPDAVSA